LNFFILSSELENVKREIRANMFEHILSNKIEAEADTRACTLLYATSISDARELSSCPANSNVLLDDSAEYKDKSPQMKDEIMHLDEFAEHITRSFQSIESFCNF
jgi:hypothetical protein